MIRQNLTGFWRIREDLAMNFLEIYCLLVAIPVLIFCGAAHLANGKVEKF